MHQFNFYYSQSRVIKCASPLLTLPDNSLFIFYVIADQTIIKLFLEKSARILLVYRELYSIFTQIVNNDCIVVNGLSFDFINAIYIIVNFYFVLNYR